MSLKIVAELAQGFEGQPEQARLLMRAAANAGADAAKYQLVYANELATPDYKYYDLFKSLEMSDDVWKGLAEYANNLSIELQLDIFGERSLKLAEEIGVKTIKLHGTDIANTGLLNKVAESTISNVLLGAGGAHLSELNHAIEILKDKEIVILLGFQGYPTPNETNQVERVRLLNNTLCIDKKNVTMGFADHSDPSNMLSVALPAMAIGAGAKLIEKHLTLGKIMQLEDYEAALNPDEFLKFSNTLKSCNHALGISALIEDFGMCESEKAYRKMIRRHVVAAGDLVAGKSIEPADLVLKRTSSEDTITDLTVVYNKLLNKAVLQNSAIARGDFN